MRPEVIRWFHAAPFATPVIGVAGGKGGVGKTAVAVNLASSFAAAGHRTALVDCDVEAPDALVFLGLPPGEGVQARVVQPEFFLEKCTDCQACIQACRRHCLLRPAERTILLMGECSGCEACFLVCPAEAIHRGHRGMGTLRTTTAGRLTVFSAALEPGAEESALLIHALMQRAAAAAEQFDVIVVDTPSGLRHTVIEALKGSAHVLVVTEPTPPGIHDLDRLLSLLDMFAVRRSIFINRADLPGSMQDLREVADRHATPVETGLRMDDQLMESSRRGVAAVQLFPQSLVARTFTGLARNLAGEYLP